MGVTIHFEGQLKSREALAQVVAIAAQVAVNEGWPSYRINEADKPLERIDGDERREYRGPTEGIRILPIDTEPFTLEFDDELRVQDYCKTQFSSIETHIQLVTLLRKLEPCFVSLEVSDEGDYWGTEDADLLREMMDDCFRAIAQAKQENGSLAGPFMLESGRIADLVDMSE